MFKMQRLEVSGAVRHIYMLLGGKGLITLDVSNLKVIYLSSVPLIYYR
jgi:hypothetical protein